MKRITSIVFAAAFIIFMRPYIIFAAIYSTADISYQQSTSTSGGQTTESSSLNEGYTFGLTHELTSTITVTGSVRLSRSVINGQETADIYPLFYLNYSPPSLEMYYFSFGYNRSENVPPGADRPISNENMNASFVLPGDRWPSVSLSYNQLRNTDNLDYPDKRLDTVSTNKGFNTDYSFVFLETTADLNYSYRDTVSIDRIGKTRNETPSHTATADFSRSFLEKKIKASANIGYTQSKNVNETKGIAATNVEGKLTGDNGLAGGLYSVDTSPLADPLDSAPALIDNNTGASAGIDLNDSYRNIGVRFSEAQKVHGLNLYISTSYASIANANFGWQLYTSSDGVTWTLIGTPSASYDALYQRIVFSFSETSAIYFKVVNTTFPAAAPTINATEIEAIGYIPTLSSTTREFGGFSISFSPFSRLSMNYNISYNHSAQDTREYNPTTEKRYLPFASGSVTSSTDSTNIGQSIGLKSVIVPQYLNLNTRYHRSTTSTASTTTAPAVITSKESETSGYSLSFSSNPLPTLNASLNYSYSESSTDGKKDSNRNSINGTVFMNLYKGVNLGLGGSMVESVGEKSRTNSTTYTGNLSLVPWRPLTIVVNGSASDSVSKTGGKETSSTGESLSTTFTYTPTRSIYFSASIGIEPTSSQNYSLTWLPAKNIQASARYGISGDTTNMGSDISWTPIQRLSLRLGYSGSTTDNATQDRSESIYASASLRL